MSRPFAFFAGLSLLLGAFLALIGCSPAPQAPPPVVPSVTVSFPIQRAITDYAEYPGRTAAIDSVQVRARVTGYLDKINFKDGSEVEQGQVLYEIDPRPYQAALNQAEAQVRLQEAQLKYQEALYNRDLRLVESGAVAKEDLQKDLAARDTTAASLNAAKAAVEQTKLNLGFTKVQSPITGRLSRTLITRGNLVVAYNTVLTSIVSEDPMYTYFDVDEQTMLHVQQLIREGKFKSVLEGAKIRVLLGLANEKGFPHRGLVDFVNNQVTPGTGTLQVRGAFANPKPPVGLRVLTPGLFVRIRVPISPPYQALLVNQRALGTDQNLRFVYTVNDQNEVVRRDVELGTELGGLQVITSGLKPDDRVIVNGIQRARPGGTVNPRLVPMPEDNSKSEIRKPIPGTTTGPPKVKAGPSP